MSLTVSRLPSTDELDEQERQLRAELYRRSYSRFFQAAWHIHEPATPLVWSWPYQAVCDHLQALVFDWLKRQRDPRALQRIQNLLCTLPPGCLKSRLLAALVPWVWTFAPQLRAISLSCNPRVALRDSMIARDIIASGWYQWMFQPRWAVRQDSDAKGLFGNTARGWRSAQGFDARIIGERGDLIIVDDPHDPEEADSDVQRMHVHERWDWSIANRVNDLGTSVRVGIAQRTHEDDWSSRRIAEGWTHLDLPMLFELERTCETPLGKPDPRQAEGDCLHPERFPSDVISIERAKGERRWATLYQGRPSPKAGHIVALESLRFYRRAHQPDASLVRPSGCTRLPAVILPDDFESVVIAADLAGGKKTERGDFNVIAALGKAGSSVFILDIWRERADFPKVQAVFREFCERWPQAGKYVEKQAAGASLVASLEAEISGLVAVPSTTGKTERLESVLSLFQANNVHLDEHADWMPYAVHEITTVPGSRFDDLADAVVIGLIQLRLEPDTRAEWAAMSRGMRRIAAGARR